MTPAQVTAFRDLRFFGRSFSFGVLLAVFVSVSGALFCRMLFAASALELPLVAVWALSVAFCLPFFCALLSSRSFSHERATGMLEMLFSAPVSERELAVGKFGASFVLAVLSVLATAVIPLLVLPQCVPGAEGGFGFVEFICPLAMLVMQCAFWCALSGAISIFFSNAASAVGVSFLICGVVPWAVYFAVLSWMPELRASVAWMPMVQHVLDATSGIFALETLVLYPAGTVFLLFASSRLLAAERRR